MTLRARRSSFTIVATLALAMALAAGATPAAAQVVGDLNAYEFPSNGAKPKPGSALTDLPAPPNFAAPKAEPHRSRPPTVTFAWGSTKMLGGPDAKTLGGPDTKPALRGYEKSHRLAR